MIAPMSREVQVTTTWRDGNLSLEIKQQQSYGTRYTIFVGPGNKNDTRLELGESNWRSLLDLIAAVTKTPEQ